MQNKYDIAVIGSGPGGYVAAIRGAQLGKKVVCIEKAELGGICLNWGCIPTKALIKNADMWREFQNAKRFGFTIDNVQFDYEKIVKRSRMTATRLSKGIEFLFKKNKVETVNGIAKFKDKNTLEIYDNGGSLKDEIYADSIIIATGARPRSIPGIEIDRKRIITSKEAMILPEVPGSIVIIGAGAIGVEFAYIFRAFHAEVRIVEALPRILPNEDEEIVRELARAFKKQRIKMHTGVIVKNVTASSDKVNIIIENDGKVEELSADYALMSIGVTPNTENIGLENIGVQTAKDRIKTNQYYETNIPGIFAIGDVIGNYCLAHVASAEGICAVEKSAGGDPAPVNYNAIPGCTYCRPQVASVGMTEKAAVDNGYQIRIGRCHFRANGKSMAIGEIDGLVKVIFDAESHKLLGAHIIGSEATELITELTQTITLGLTYQQIKNVIHAHPTLAESVIEAVHDAYDEAVHV